MNFYDIIESFAAKASSKSSSESSSTAKKSKTIKSTISESKPDVSSSLMSGEQNLTTVATVTGGSIVLDNIVDELIDEKGLLNGRRSGENIEHFQQLNQRQTLPPAPALASASASASAPAPALASATASASAPAPASDPSTPSAHCAPCAAPAAAVNSIVDTFYPSLWQWTLDEKILNDGEWHFYEIKLNYPKANLYIDGQLFAENLTNSDIIDAYELKNDETYSLTTYIGAGVAGCALGFGLATRRGVCSK